MKHIPKTLVLSRSLPPALSGSSIIIANLALQFSREEMLLFGFFEPNRPANPWTTAVPHIVYTLPHSPQWRGERWVKWLQLPWVLLHAFIMLLFGQCKLILAIYPSDIFLLVGYLLSRISGKPLFVYFHNTYLDNMPRDGLAQWLQPKIFERAAHVFVMSEGMVEFYKAQYPHLKKISALVHSFTGDRPRFENLPAIQNPVKLFFVGNINASCIDAASRFAELVRQRDDVHLTLLTGTPIAQLEKVGFTSKNITVYTISRDAVHDSLQQADIVLLPHGFTSQFSEDEIRTIFPTKVIDYLLSGRPILAHLPSDSFLAKFMGQNQCAMLVEEANTSRLNEALNTLIEDAQLRETLVKNALDTALMFEATKVAEDLRSTINQYL